ncbi:ferredoxin [Mycobacterium avium subsp. hominissuis]
MKILLDASRCAGHALCNAVDPELFPLDDDGYSTLVDRSVSSADEKNAHAGVAACPEAALILAEDA